MRFVALTLSALLAAPSLAGRASRSMACPENYVGYLFSTFTDPTPKVLQYISTVDAPLDFSPLNGGEPVLTSTVGTEAVRDIFITSKPERDEFFIIATDLNFFAPDLGDPLQTGSRAIVVWRSENLVDWTGPDLRTVEEDIAGNVWAPNAIWNEEEQQYYVFWSSRLYEAGDTGHTGEFSSLTIRYATTKDFATFSAPQTYLSTTSGTIDQEFLYLGEPGSYARFLTSTGNAKTYQEITTDGIFGTWTRNEGYVNESSPYEGAGTFADVKNPGTYYMALDNYEEYIPYKTTNIEAAEWEVITDSSFPLDSKHGNFLPLTAKEYERIIAAYS